MQFIEGGAESDTNSDSEGVDLVEDLNEADTVDDDSSHLSEHIGHTHNAYFIHLILR